MNGHYNGSSSLEGQLAAVAISVIRQVQNRMNTAGQPEIPGVKDFEEAFRIHTKIAELRFRLDERDKLDRGNGYRRAELVQQLYALVAQLPKEFHV